MGLVGEPIVEHIEYRVPASEHDAFIAAFEDARRLRLAARGCRNVEVTRGGGVLDEYRARIEWRSSLDQAAFAASEAGIGIERTMVAFERRAYHLDTPVLFGPSDVPLDAVALRRAFGHYPTGIAVITATGPDGPTGLVVSSFTTVSLEPALVAFCAAHTSTTWPVIEDAGVCCINVFAASQGDLCRQLASRREDRFEGVAWSASPSGAPILAGVVGWLDCRIVEVRLAGDHDLVLLQVLAHDATTDLEPLVFHRSGYRTLASPLSRTVP